MTRVIFRKFKKSGDIIAFFPDTTEDCNPPFIMSYMHVGQHGEADYDGLLSETMPAKPEEYHDLLQELISIGYDYLVIKNKWIRR